MKNLKIYLLSILFGAASVFAQNDQKNADRIDSILSAYTKKDMFAGSVLIAKNGKVLLSKGYGMANYSYDIPNTSQTKFKLASVSKQFTAMAIMILEEKGKLKTDDKLSKYISDYPSGDKISIHHLLTHTSGVPSFTGFENYDTIKRFSHSIEQEIAYFKNKPLDFEPGSRFNYSNSGYVLLSFIIEKASGKKYGEVVDEYIFKPLGMKNSGQYPTNGVLRNEAIGYSWGIDGPVPAPFIDMSIPSGAGALYSTVEDLFLWDRALNTEKLVKKTTLDKIFTPYKDNYAYGWKVDNYHGHKWITHNGGIEGFATTINRFTDDDLTIILLKNVDNMNIFAAHKVARQVMFNEPVQFPAERKRAKIDPKIYTSLTGEYQIAPDFIMTVTTADDKIYVQASGQPQFEVFPESELMYFPTVVDALLEFSKDEKGNINMLTLHQNGAKMPGKKIK